MNRRAQDVVGWVERSEPHQHNESAEKWWGSLRSIHPTLRPSGKGRRHRRRGVLLLLVLVVIALLSLSGYTYCRLMQSEREAVDLTGRQAQARALADSGLEAARLFLSQDKAIQSDAGGCYNNPARFQRVRVTNDPSPHESGCFTLLVSQGDDSQGNAALSGMASGVRYGLEDQSNRLNLNALPLYEQYQSGSGRTILMGLPGMTEQIADAILDWLDKDSTARESGAESEYYSTLDPPYAPRNGPLGTIEELLLVKGVTPSLLFGVDANRNGYSDAGEPDPMAMEGIDNSDRSMDRGWSAYLTLWAMERNVQPDGTARVNVNQSDMQQLYEQVQEAMGEDWAKFIVAYRMNGPMTSTSTSASPSAATTTANTPLSAIQLDLSNGASNTKNTLKTVLDLVGAKVSIPRASTGNNPGQNQGQNSSNAQVVASPLSAEQTDFATVATLVDKLTVYSAKTIPGRININCAPRAVLKGLPGMTEEIVEKIIANRQQDPTVPNPTRTNETWILAEGLVTVDQMKALLPYVNVGGDIYRAESVGFYESGGPTARIEAIIDATASPPAVLFWREISHLGRGYPAEVLGMEAL